MFVCMFDVAVYIYILFRVRFFASSCVFVVIWDFKILFLKNVKKNLHTLVHLNTLLEIFFNDRN